MNYYAMKEWLKRQKTYDLKIIEQMLREIIKERQIKISKNQSVLADWKLEDSRKTI